MNVQTAKPNRVYSWARTTLHPSAIRTRTGLIFFLGMSILILSTVGATVWVNSLVNLDTERAALLAQLQTRVLGWSKTSPLGSSSTLAADQAEMMGILHILLNGGELTRSGGSTEFPIEGDADLVRHLQSATESLSALQTSGADNHQQAAAQKSLKSALGQGLDFVRLRRAENLGMARGIYASLFISISCFLLVGLWFTEEWIARPMEELIDITSRISTGDLDTPIQPSEGQEFIEVVESLEAMRVELRDSREKLARWAKDLEERVAQRTQQLIALSRVVTAASRSLELEQILHTALEQALQVVGVEIGGIWLVDEASGDLSLSVSQGMSQNMREQLRVIQAGEGISGEAVKTGETIVLEDIDRSSLRGKMIASDEELRSLVAVPIKVHERVLSVLDVMTRRQRAFSPEELTLLTSIGQQIGIGIENARLIQEIRQQTERVAALQERDWISAELHDGLLQTLGYLYLQADQLETLSISRNWPEMAEKLAHQRQVLEQISGDIRRFIADLRKTPPPVYLRDALQKMVTEFSQKTPVEVSLDMEQPLRRLKADHVAHLVRIAHEALINATQHGHAGKVTITCSMDGTQGELTIVDNGEGFSPEWVPARGGEHFGLSIMRARASRLGGHFALKSTPGQGTSVTITWPLEMAQEGSPR
jgi:two-component system nitrate/nitrite sensor histidine kinase NarX